MKKRIILFALVVVLAISAGFYWKIYRQQNTPQYNPKTLELIAIVEQNPNIKMLLLASIAQAKKINPDPETNPAQTLEQYYEFVSFAEKAMPWNLLPKKKYPSLFKSIDQSLCYFYFINDQPLEQLKDKGYYNNSLQYVEPYASWLISFDKDWGHYLDSEVSWNDDYYQRAFADGNFGLQNGWYEDPRRWKTFNQFFSRYLKSTDKRPIASPNDPAIVASPADSEPQGFWQIDEKSQIVQREGVAIKSGTLNSIEKLIGVESNYKASFANGTFTHSYLDVNDYHRYHFPVGGVIKEMRIIPEQNAAGCIITWDSQNQRYAYDASVPGWQSVETRACVVIDTEKYGLVALLPIGMSQVCSVNFEKNLKVGDRINKGDMMGYFLFGGSDFMMIFQKKAKFSMNKPVEKGKYKKLLMGQEYGVMLSE